MTRQSPGSPNPGPVNKARTAKQAASLVSVPAQVRRRCSAARRMPPVDGRWGPRDLAVYDPSLQWPAPWLGPCTFGLDEVELAAEVRRRYDEGWQRWELGATFALPGLAAWSA